MVPIPKLKLNIYEVGLRKEYFAPEDRSAFCSQLCRVHVEVVKIKDTSRTNAAMAAWWNNGGLRDKWRSKMMPHIKHISLEVGDRTVPGNGGVIGRLAPIKVE